MHPPASALAARTACGLLLSVTLLACTSSSSEPQDVPDGAVPAVDLPAVESFTDGTCAVVADDVVAIGGAIGQLGPGGMVEPAVKDSLREAQTRIFAVAETAEPEIKPALDDLVIKVGIVRIRADGNTYETAQGELLTTSYEAVVGLCTTA